MLWLSNPVLHHTTSGSLLSLCIIQHATHRHTVRPDIVQYYYYSKVLLFRRRGQVAGSECSDIRGDRRSLRKKLVGMDGGGCGVGSCDWADGEEVKDWDKERVGVITTPHQMLQVWMESQISTLPVNVRKFPQPYYNQRYSTSLFTTVTSTSGHINNPSLPCHSLLCHKQKRKLIIHASNAQWSSSLFQGEGGMGGGWNQLK